MSIESLEINSISTMLQPEIAIAAKKEFDIAVNGVAEVWHRRNITYEEVVKLAFPSGPTGGDIRYSVSWTKPDGQEGSLRPGHNINVVDGMIFDVRNTDKS